MAHETEHTPSEEEILPQGNQPDQYDLFFQRQFTRRQIFTGLGFSGAAIISASALKVGIDSLWKWLKSDPAAQRRLTASEIYTPRLQTPIDSDPPPTSETIPPPNPEEIAQREVGEQNAAEYFLSDLIKHFKEERRKKFENPVVRERINPEALESETIAFVVAGIDNTRERPDTRNDQGWGRADLFMLVCINPHTFAITLISFPRDLFVPELRDYERAFTNGLRINETTQVPYILQRYPNQFPAVDVNDFIRKIVETATGRVVDGVLRFDIDAIQGYSYGNEPFSGIIDTVFPEGLEIFVSQ